MEQEENQKKLNELPHVPGVYFFRNKIGEVIYIGKAIDLARRVRSYFLRDDAIGHKTNTLRAQIEDIEVIKTASEFDALLLEANLIRKYSPKYNTISKDDKSPLYITINLNDKLPRIRLSRQSQVIKFPGTVIGPFQSGKVLRNLLSSLRRIIPYCTQKPRNGKPCFYTHLGLCNPCASVIDKMAEGKEKTSLTHLYRRNIHELIRIFEGKSREVLDDLHKDMTIAAKKENFEEASDIKSHIEALYTLLTRHYDPLVYEKATFGSIVDEEVNELTEILQKYFPKLTTIDRIECIDISNLGGTNATGSLVILRNGIPSPTDYRRFRIRTKKTQNDPAMISEVVARRIAHSEWPLPQLLVVDGGKAQLNAALESLKKRKLNIPTIGLAKRNEELVVRSSSGYKTVRLPLDSGAIHVVQRIRDEAHRFARHYHLFLRDTLREAINNV